MSFFAELKRRNVFRVGIAYVVIGWLLAQVAEFLFENFGAPEWALRTFAIFLFLGLPLALFFAWAFEVTPEGIKLEKNVDRSQSITAQTGRKLDFMIIGVLVVAVGFLLVDKFLLGTPDVPSDEMISTDTQSIAVLPFVNMSDDNDYFADGLSEELLNLLAKIPNLNVAGRTSSFAFKGRNEDLREIGEALGVAKVLEGSVRRSGDRLRVTVQLINVADGFHIWSETYDRQMADIFDIQDDVAGAITSALKLHLSPQSDRLTQNPEAYALYLEALALQSYSGAADVILALELLDQAIALDPMFARAYELKAAFHWFQAGWLVDAPAGQMLTYEAATKALELDSTLSGARAFASTAHPEWNWIMEFEALEEAIRVEPDNVSAIQALAWSTVVAGYYDESIRLAQRIIELEPLAPHGYWRKGVALLGAGRRAEAHAMLEKAAEFDETASISILALDSVAEREYEKAISWLERLYLIEGKNPADARPFIENARDSATGKAYLDNWITSEFARASDIYQRGLLYQWYLPFGHINDFWLGLEKLQAGTAKGWTNADTLEQGGMVLRHTGYARHRKYLPRSKESSLMDLWDTRGPPDHCKKEDGEWVCE